MTVNSLESDLNGHVTSVECKSLHAMDGTQSDHVIDVKKMIEYVISLDAANGDIIPRCHYGMQAIIINSIDVSAYEAEKVTSTSDLQVWNYGP